MDGCACLFLVFGLGVHATGFDNYDGRNPLPLANPLGRIEAGYEFANGIEIKLEHTSQILRVDTGLNMLVLEKRWNLKAGE